MEDNTTKKTSRTDNSREKTKRNQPWRPPSSLEAPEAPPGFKHRWIRAETLGTDDKKNMAARLIGVGGLVLARIPNEIVESRAEYFAEQTKTQEEAVDNNLFKEQHRSMPISSERNSRVTFGGGRGNKK